MSRLKALQAELRDSELKLRDFAEAASDGFWEMDRDLKFTYFSPWVEEITGVPVEFRLGKTREELASEAADTTKWRAYLEDLRQRRPFHDFRYARRGHDGRVQHLSSSGKPIFGAVGSFLGCRGIGRDITQQVVVEKRFQDARDLLASASTWRSSAPSWNRSAAPPTMSPSTAKGRDWVSPSSIRWFNCTAAG
ncbi:MAG: PAS domain-containing protein [Rhodospirillaceae bacterium]